MFQRLDAVSVFRWNLLREVQRTRQWVYNIPYDCGRCEISETSRPLGVHIKEHKYKPDKRPRQS
jgi:hypothetical protein